VSVDAGLESYGISRRKPDGWTQPRRSGKKAAAPCHWRQRERSNDECRYSRQFHRQPWARCRADAVAPRCFDTPRHRMVRMCAPGVRTCERTGYQRYCGRRPRHLRRSAAGC